MGWHETDLRAKDTIALEAGKGISVMHASMSGWVLYRGTNVLAAPGNPVMENVPFDRGMYATLEHPGGAVIIFPMAGLVAVTYRSEGAVSFSYQPGTETIAAGDRIHYAIGFAGASGKTTADQIVGYARTLGIAEPGHAGYRAELTHGRPLDTYAMWHVDAEGRDVAARIPRAEIPGYLPACIEGLHDHWSVALLDRNRPWPNVRALPVRDGRAFAQLDLVPADSDLFIGHPVTADRDEVRLLVSWMEPGVWFVEAHNPTDTAMRVHVATSPRWPLFALDETIELAAGTSRIWHVKEAK
jgi:hypothetical protein